MMRLFMKPARAFRNQELARKLIWINCLLILVPLAAMGVYTFASFQHAMEKNVGSYQLQTLRQVSLNIDTYMNELDRLTLTPYSYKEIMDFISSPREPGQPLSLEEIESLNRFVSSIFINGRLDIMGVSLYGEKGASYVVLPEPIHHHVQAGRKRRLAEAGAQPLRSAYLHNDA